MMTEVQSRKGKILLSDGLAVAYFDGKQYFKTDSELSFTNKHHIICWLNHTKYNTLELIEQDKLNGFFYINEERNSRN